MCTNNDCLDTSQITIPTGADGADGAAGAAGADGTDGTDGNFGGFSGRWLFDNTTGVDPAATFLRFDNTVLSAVTGIYVNNTNADTVDYSNFLASFANTVDGTNQFGLIKVWKRFDSNTFFYGKMTDYATAAAGKVFPVTHIESNGTFAANDELVISFTPNGTSANLDKEVLTNIYNTAGTATNGTTTLTTLSNYTIPADTLAADEDTIEFSAHLVKFGTIPSAVVGKITIAGVDVHGTNWALGSGAKSLKVDVRLTRISATQAFMEFKSWLVDTGSVMVPSFGGYKTIAFTSNVANIIDVLGASADGLGNTIKLENLLIKKFDK